jgi:hypothetical protein
VGKEAKEKGSSVNLLARHILWMVADIFRASNPHQETGARGRSGQAVIGSIPRSVTPPRLLGGAFGLRCCSKWRAAASSEQVSPGAHPVLRWPRAQPRVLYQGPVCPLACVTSRVPSRRSIADQWVTPSLCRKYSAQAPCNQSLVTLGRDLQTRKANCGVFPLIIS